MNILNYDLHPIFVHFPIALLTLYCVFEIISWGKLRTNNTWSFMKAVLVTVGGLSLLVARQFGESARSLLENQDLLQLVAKHETFANLTTAVFGIIAAAYVLVLIRMYLERNPSSGFWSFFSFLFPLQRFMTETPVAQLLAIIGLAALTITGALGGSIVYGPSNDPITDFVYRILFP